MERITRSKCVTCQKINKKEEYNFSDHSWVDLEKKLLLIELKKFGLESKHVLKCLKNKTEDQIKKFLRNRMKCSSMIQKAKEQRKKKKDALKWGKNLELNSSLEQWLEYLTKLSENEEFKNNKRMMLNLLPYTFLCISLFEEHPDVTDSNDVDFREVYEFFFSILMGHPLKNFRAVDVEYILNMLSDVFKKFKDVARTEEAYHIHEIRHLSRSKTSKRFQCIKTYKGKKAAPLIHEDSSKTLPDYFLNILSIPSLNPLKVSAKCVSMHVRGIADS